MVLSESEILDIKSFVSKAKEIPEVECVYILPFFYANANKDMCEVVAIYNDRLFYNYKLTGVMGWRDTKQEKAQLNTLVGQARAKSKKENNSLRFDCKDSDDYSVACTNKRELVAERTLISSIVLFDRFGDIERNIEVASQKLEQYQNIVDIENIDELNSKKVKELEIK